MTQNAVLELKSSQLECPACARLFPIGTVACDICIGALRAVEVRIVPHDTVWFGRQIEHK